MRKDSRCRLFCLTHAYPLSFHSVRDDLTSSPSPHAHSSLYSHRHAQPFQGPAQGVYDRIDFLENQMLEMKREELGKKRQIIKARKIVKHMRVDLGFEVVKSSTADINNVIKDIARALSSGISGNSSSSVGGGGDARDTSLKRAYSRGRLVNSVSMKAYRKSLKIHHVRAKSPAAEGGLRGNDMLLTIQGHMIRTKEEYSACMKTLQLTPGTELCITVLRDGQRRLLTLVTGAYGFSTADVFKLKNLARRDDSDFGLKMDQWISNINSSDLYSDRDSGDEDAYDDVL